jgi:hypothetical protein
VAPNGPASRGDQCLLTGVKQKRAIKDGIRKDGTRLRPPMGFAWYARMTEADLNAVVAYLRTVPPLE